VQVANAQLMVVAGAAMSRDAVSLVRVQVANVKLMVVAGAATSQDAVSRA